MPGQHPQVLTGKKASCGSWGEIGGKRAEYRGTAKQKAKNHMEVSANAHVDLPSRRGKVCLRPQRNRYINREQHRKRRLAHAVRVPSISPLLIRPTRMKPQERFENP